MSHIQKSERDLLTEKINLQERQLRLRSGLPFLHGWKWYPWAREFFESTNRICLLTAANQISKSSTQIRKCIDWATNQGKWPELWSHKPTMFWYLYPSSPVATIEFEKKWKLFLPTEEFKDDPVYGWRSVYKNKEIYAIHFKSGVSVYFKTYAQDVMDLQSATVDAIFCDEELPVEKYDELMVRLTASNGYFSMVFTATIGQEFWRLCMEPEVFEEECLPMAFKQTISMYDCQKYEDGTQSQWTDEAVSNAKARCKSDKEIAKRIYGKFVKDDFGRKYEQFSVKDHMKIPATIPSDWLIYAGVDIGSGGKENHPAAIAFVAVRPDYRSGRVFLGWRGDHIETTAGDVMNKFIELRDTHRLTLACQYYDWGSKDFGTIAQRIGEPFLKAEKSHEIGEEVINVLFKNNMLYIYDSDELQKLASELISLRKETPKNKSKDDLIDAMRYAITSVPWDFTAITSAEINKPIEKKKETTPMEDQINDRRKFIGSEQSEDSWGSDAEIAEWNEAYG